MTALTKEEINKEKAEEAIHYLEPFAFNIQNPDVKKYVCDLLVMNKNRVTQINKAIDEQFAQEEQIRLQKAEEEEKRQRLLADMMLTTGNSFDGYTVEKYIDVISEEVVFKNSLGKQLGAGIDDLINSLSFKERELTGTSELIANARKYAMEKFKRTAAEVGANAVLGIDLESSVGSDIVRVAIFGTAVIVIPK
ncbi:MAG: heavy metal-binding domain-containing protein [Firmicutes bacterium]|nr:heavy metal-binding domain-containing protein [Bacillota bacterium]